MTEVAQCLSATLLSLRDFDKTVLLKRRKILHGLFIMLTLFSNNNIHGNYSMWHQNIPCIQYNSQNDYYLNDIRQET